MIDRLAIEDLAEAPPEYWSAIIERTAVLKEYLSQPDRGASAADVYARRLGVQRKQFFRIFEKFEQRTLGRTARWWQNGTKRPRCPEQESVLKEARGNLGPGARERQLFAEAARVAAQRGCPAPSSAVVRARFASIPTELGLSRRLGISNGLIVDACRLAVDSLSAKNQVQSTFLIAAIDVASGRVAHYKLGDIEMDGRALVQELMTSIITDRIGGSSVPIIVTLPVAAQLPEHQTGGVPVQVVGAKRMRGGEALQSIYGRRIGRIVLRTSSRRMSNPVAPASVVTMVVGSLIARRNADLDVDPLIPCIDGRHACHHSPQGGKGCVALLPRQLRPRLRSERVYPVFLARWARS